MNKEILERFKSLSLEIDIQVRLYPISSDNFIQFYNYYFFIKNNNILTDKELISLADSLANAEIFSNDIEKIEKVKKIKKILATDVANYKINFIRI